MASVVRHGFEHHFKASRRKVWDALADTARYNEATGLPKHDVRDEVQPDGSVRFFAEARMGPFNLAWEDIPQEWVQGRWFRHKRLFSRGPFTSLLAVARFEDGSDGDGSVCSYTLEVEPHGLLGRLILKLGFFAGAERAFRGVAADIETWAEGERETAYTGRPPDPDPVRKSRIDTAIERIESSRYGHGLGRRLADWLMTAQEVDLMRIRPLQLARLWDAPERYVVELCFEAVKDGLLESRWDLLCPRCRGAKLQAHALDELPSGAHCTSCNISYDRDFSRNVELTFQPAPSIRQVTHGEFCLFGPMTTPHIRVQLSVPAGQVEEVEVTLEPGPYRVRTLEPGGERHFDFSGGDFPAIVADGEAVGLSPDTPGGGKLRLENKTDRRRTFVIEARNWVSDALTAHRATTLQAFRHLFSDAVLKGGDEVAIAHITLLFTDLKGSTELYERVGDAPAYGLVRDHFDYLGTHVREHNGAVIKTIGDAVMAAFADPVDGLKCAITIQSDIKAFNDVHKSMPISIKAGVHVGSTIAVTLNERLDYFGGMVNMAARLQGESEEDEVVLSQAMLEDPAVAEVLEGAELEQDRRLVRGFAEEVTYWRLRAPFPDVSEDADLYTEKRSDRTPEPSPPAD